jgi:hypothetical protein
VLVTHALKISLALLILLLIALLLITQIVEMHSVIDVQLERVAI